MNTELSVIIEDICDKDPRYDRYAYEFVMEALAFAQKKFKRSKHVSGVELLDGMRDLLINRYGPMAMTLLKFWRVKTTDDFGNIVFNLVENRVLSKTDEDNIESFRNVFDFEEEFDRRYKKQLAQKISRMR